MTKYAVLLALCAVSMPMFGMRTAYEHKRKYDATLYDLCSAAAELAHAHNDKLDVQRTKLMRKKHLSVATESEENVCAQMVKSGYSAPVIMLEPAVNEAVTPADILVAMSRLQDVSEIDISQFLADD